MGTNEEKIIKKFSRQNIFFVKTKINDFVMGQISSMKTITSSQLMRMAIINDVED